MSPSGEFLMELLSPRLSRAQHLMAKGRSGHPDEHLKRKENASTLSLEFVSAGNAPPATLSHYFLLRQTTNLAFVNWGSEAQE
jgi:hypothetical protein